MRQPKPIRGDAYQEVWRKYGLDSFAIMYTSADMMPLARRLFNDPQWVPVHFDDNSLLFVRDIESMRPLITAHRVDFAALARERSQSAPPATWSVASSALRGCRWSDESSRAAS